MSDRDYGIEDRARKQARTLGLTPEEVQSYVRQSAAFTHDMFNRRYQQFVFMVERRTVVEIGLYEDNDPRKRLRESTTASSQMAAAEVMLLAKCHAMLEDLADTVRDFEWGDDDVAELEELIDELEPYRAKEGDEG